MHGGFGMCSAVGVVRSDREKQWYSGVLLVLFFFPKKSCGL